MFTRRYRVRHVREEESPRLMRVSASVPGVNSVNIHRTFAVLCGRSITIFITSISVIFHVAVAISIGRTAGAATVIVVSIAVSLTITVAVSTIVLAR